MAKPKRRKETSKRPAKRTRTEIQDNETAEITRLLFGSGDIPSVIFSFLELRPLLRFVSLSKTFSECLSYKHVIFAAMMAGRNANMTIENLLDPIRERTIWMPSPMRLLRLTCGRRCEICLKNQVLYIPPTFGVFLCQRECMKEYTGSLRECKKWNPYANHDRTALGRRHGSKRANLPDYFFTKPLTDKMGERIGPLLTIEKIIDLEENAPSSFEQSQRKEKVDAWMSHCDALQPDSENKMQQILQATNESHEESAVVLKGRKEEKEAAKNMRMKKRKQKVDILLAEFEALVGSKVPWQTNLSNRQWSPENGHYDFDDPLIDSVVGKAFLAPSKLKKKVLRELVDKVQSLYDDRALADQHIATIIAKVDHTNVQGTMRREWCRHINRYDFRDCYLKQIVEYPLANPRSLQPKDVANLSKQVSRHFTNKEKSDELLGVLERRLEGEVGSRLGWRCWDPIEASYTFEPGIDSILGKDFERPHEITNARLKKLAKRLKRKIVRR